ncbi:MAG: PAS domain-containing protein [Cyanobacterium sp.]
MTQYSFIEREDLESAILRFPLMVSPQTRLKSAIALMGEKGCYGNQDNDRPLEILETEIRSTCVMVVESNKVVGILTQRDIIQISLNYSSLDNLVIGEVMQSPVITLKEKEFNDLPSAINLFRQHNIRHLPIVDENDNLVGLVTHETLIRLSHQEQTKQLEEKQKTEQQLKESEHRFRQLAENIDQIFYLTNLESTETYYISPCYESIWGKSCQSLYDNPTSYLDNVHPEDKHIVLQALENQKFEQQTTLEYRIIRPDGEIRWILDRTFHVKTSDFTPPRVCGIVEDITAGKLNEIELIESTKELEIISHRLQEAQRIAKLGHWEYDHLEDTLYWSQQCFSIFELDPHQFTPTYDSFLELTHPGDRPLVHKSYTNHLNNHSPYNVCHRIITPHGQIKYLQEQCETEYTPEGKAIISRGTVQDITTLKQAEIELAQLNQQLEQKVALRTQELWRINHLQKTILNSTDYAIISIDCQGYIQTFNRGAEKMLGYTSTEILNKTTPLQFLNIEEVQALGLSISPESSPEISLNSLDLKSLSSKLKQNLKQEFTIHPIKKNGTSFPLSITINPLKNEQGEIIGFLGIGKDITKQEEARIYREKAEQKLAQSQHFLQTLLDTLPLSVFWKDTNSNFLGCNRTLTRLMNIPDTVDISDLSKIKLSFTAEELKQCKKDDQQVISTGKPLLMIEESMTLPDGNLMWIEANKAPLKNERNEIIGLVGVFNDITQKRQDKIEKQKLLQELSAFKQGLDKAAVVTITDEKGIITYANDQLSIISGYSNNELLGTTHKIVNSGYHPPSFFKNLWNTIQKGEIWRGEICNKAKSGKLYWVQTTIVPFLDQNNQPFQYLAIRFDITSRKLTEIENLNLRERLEFALSSSPAIIYSCDASREEFPVKFISPNVQTIVNYNSEDFLSGLLRWNDFIHPEDKENIDQILKEKLFHNGYSSIEYRFLTGNGDYIWLQDEMVLCKDTEGNPRNIVGYVANINERKQAQIQLAKKNKLLSTISKAESQFITAENRLIIFEQLLSDLLELTDSEYGFISEVCFKDDGSAFLEGNLLKIKGVPHLKAQSITNISWNEETEKYYQENFEQGMEFHNMETLFGAVVVTGKPVIANNPSTDSRRGGIPEGHPPLNSFLGLPFFSGSKLMGVVGIANAVGGYDNTLIEYLQPFLMTCSILVEGFRLDQQKKLAEKQLFESNQQLIRANRLKDEFLANMSHELRTPLNAILGMAEGLSDKVFGDVNDRQIKALKTIERSGTHLLELINDILDLAKIEAEHLELDCDSISISSLADSSLAFVKQLALKKRVQLNTDLPSPFPDLIVDQRRIRQVLINLLNNAVKFTPKGGSVTLKFSCNPPLQNPDFFTHIFENRDNYSSFKNYIYISVIDTGIGITPDNIKKLFQPFIQIDSALNRQYAGTGLGLSLVKKIVELHGGYVIVSSRLGVGSCFTVVLPCNSCNTETTSNNDRTLWNTSSPNISSSTLEKPLILLAEDNEANVRTIGNYLKAKGYRLIFAEDGEKAVSLAISDTPDLILMDIQMPKMSGFEAIALIRQNEQLSNTPIIALTALAMKGDQEKCLKTGANEYLSKPLKMKELVTKIKQLLMVSPT